MRRLDSTCGRIIAGSNLRGDAPPWAKSVRPGDGSGVLHGALDTLHKPRAAPFYFSAGRP